MLPEYQQNSASAFKHCPSCDIKWISRDSFLRDDQTVFSGYQPHFEKLTAGFFIFTHRRCGTTMAITLGQFKDIYADSLFQTHSRDAETPDFCFRSRNQGKCPAQCECSSVEQLIQIITHWGD